MGVAALWIYVFHIWIPIIDSGNVLSNAEQFIKRIGFYGVDIFFFLSGMGLINAIEKRTVCDFYKRRISRVFLPFVIMALVKLAAGKLALESWPWANFIKDITGYHFLTENIYTFLWFVPAIMILYLLFPLYYKIFSKVSDKVQFTLLVLVLWWYISVLVENVMRADLYGFTNRLPIFLSGVLVGWSIREGESVFTKLTWILLLSICGLGFFFAYMTNYRGMYLMVPSSNCCVPGLLLALSGCCLLAKIFLFMDSYKGKAILKFFDFFGKISLELYCVQEMMGDAIIATLNSCYEPHIINGITFAGVLLSALLLVGVCRIIRKVFHWILTSIGIILNINKR